MSDTQIKNKNNVIEQESSSSQQKDKKDILVSIVLTESTTSLLQLDLPHLEDLDSENSQSSVCAIKAETNINNEARYSGNHVSSKRRAFEFTRYWFGSNETKGDHDYISSEVAYFRSNPDMNDSIMSFDMVEGKNLT